MLLHMSRGQKKRQMKICNFATRMLSIMNEYYGFSVQLSFSAEFRFLLKKHVAFEHFKVKGKCYLPGVHLCHILVKATLFSLVFKQGI